MEYSRNILVRVGLLFLMFIISIFIVLFYLGKFKNKGDYYYIYLIFRDVSGLGRDSKVFMAGVEIGKIEDISFNSNYTVKVKAKILKNYKIPYNSIFYIGGSLMGERYLNIEPVNNSKFYQPNEFIYNNTYPMVDWYQVLKQSYLAFQELEQTSRYFRELVASLNLPNKINQITYNVNSLLYDTKKDINLLTYILSKNIELISNNTNLLLLNANQTVLNINSKVDRIGNSLYNASSNLNDIIASNKQDIRVIVSNIKYTSENLNEITYSIRDLLNNTTLKEDLLQTLKHLRNMAKSLEVSASNIENIVKDEKLKEDLRVSISKLREVVEVSDFLLTPAKKLKEQTMNQQDFRFASVIPCILSIEDYKHNPVNSLSIDIFPNSRQGFRIGLFDLGYENLLDLQITYNQGDIRYRAGLMYSELGVAIDKRFSKNFSFTAELLRPSKVQLNTFLDYNFKNIYLRAGYMDVLTKDRKFTVGTYFKF
jgi:phospholipid/cholesterol/gamma-HCH transport system substrate-binding protein